MLTICWKGTPSLEAKTETAARSEEVSQQNHRAPSDNQKLFAEVGN